MRNTAVVATWETYTARYGKSPFAGRRSLSAGPTKAAGSTAQLPLGSAFLTIGNVLLALLPSAVTVAMHTTIIGGWPRSDGPVCGCLYELRDQTPRTPKFERPKV